MITRTNGRTARADNTPETLSTTRRHLMATRWAGLRSRDTINALLEPSLAILKSKGVEYAEDVTKETALELLEELQRRRETPTQINKRFMYLKTLGVSWVPRLKETKPRKWWLRPEDKEIVDQFLEDWDSPHSEMVADYIEWVVFTGLRVEECLRLKRSDFVDLFTDQPSLTIPGTKTVAAGNVTMAIAQRAADVARRRLGQKGLPGDRLFKINYQTLAYCWDKCREAIGAEDIKTATLRALRRSAARYLHAECGMPLDAVRQYLRHEKVETTMGYLRLVGGYDTKEMRRWLEPQNNSESYSRDRAG